TLLEEREAYDKRLSSVSAVAVASESSSSSSLKRFLYRDPQNEEFFHEEAVFGSSIPPASPPASPVPLKKPIEKESNSHRHPSKSSEKKPYTKTVGFNLDGSRVSGYGSVCEAQLCVKIRVDKYRNAWQRTRDLTSGFTSSWFTYSSGNHGIIPTSHFMQVEKDESKSASFLITTGDKKNATRTQQQHGLFESRKLARRKVKECSKIARERTKIGSKKTQQKDSKNCVLESKKVARNHSKWHE
ncbi:hypothetical protein Tco_1309465, partial [Tanacetum coccineum]